MLSTEHMSALPHSFKDMPDTRRAQGRRHPLPVVLAIAAAAALCGMDGYKAIQERGAPDHVDVTPPDHGRIETRRIWCSAVQANPQRVHATNRGHWAVGSFHYMIDWNFNEDRSRIRTGHGPENVTRLRRFAIGVLKGYGSAKVSISEKMRSLNRNIRLVFDYLRMTKNSSRLSTAASS